MSKSRWEFLTQTAAGIVGAAAASQAARALRRPRRRIPLPTPVAVRRPPRHCAGGRPRGLPATFAEAEKLSATR
jgi:hypothetical protein